MTAAPWPELPSASVRRLCSLVTRSDGLVDLCFFQWLTAKAVNAVTTVLWSQRASRRGPEAGLPAFDDLIELLGQRYASGWAKIVRMAARTILAEPPDAGQAS